MNFRTTTILLLSSLLTSLQTWVIAFSPLYSRTPSFAKRIPLRLELSSSNTNELTPLSNGSFCALVTPFKPDGSLDTASLRNLLQFHKTHNTDGLCILGTTGEASTLSSAERDTVISIAVEECKGILPLLIGTGTVNPASVKSMTLRAKDLGADAALVVTPYYVKPPQRALIKHFHDAAQCGLPVVMYNVPGRTGVDMKPETVALAAQSHEGIVAVKEATGDLSRVAVLKETCPDGFKLYSGDDGTAAEFGLLGGDGTISVTANVAPAEMHLVMTLGASEAQKVREINHKLDLLHSKLFVESNPIPAKWAVKRLGLIETAYCRPPLCEMDAQFEPVVEDAMEAAGILGGKTGPTKREAVFA